MMATDDTSDTDDLRRTRAAGDPVALVRLGDALEREERFPAAWRCLADGAAIRAKTAGRVRGQQWAGETDPGGRLGVLRLMRHAGAQLRMARAVAQLAQSGMDITLCVEPRLLALFARSFPEIAVVPDTETDSVLARCDYWASYERVAQFVWTTPDIITDSFRPLLADAALTDLLRDRYRGGAAAFLIGLSWFSSNTRKDLPAPADWAGGLAGVACRALSLQYAPDTADLAGFERALGIPVQTDVRIDPLRDFDGFAAQIMACDLVLTISNTTAHMAGALGKACIVVLDDRDHLIWPAAKARSVCYPNLRLVRRNGRPWAAVFDAIGADLRAGHAV